VPLLLGGATGAAGASESVNSLKAKEQYDLELTVRFTKHELLHAGDHVRRECLSAFPDIYKFRDFLLLVFRRVLDQIAQHDRQRVSYHLDT
jgi:hypothetical protein